MAANKLLALKQAREEKIHNLDGELYFNILKKIASDCKEAGLYSASSTQEPFLNASHNTTSIPALLTFVYMGVECNEALTAMREDVYSKANTVSPDILEYYQEIKAEVAKSLAESSSVDL